MSFRLHVGVLVSLVTVGIACAEPSRFAGSAPRTIATFVPAGLEVHGEYVAEFETDQGPVRLTYVEYGTESDCSSGCFSSFVCAIEDGEQEELYYAWWNPGRPEEVPLELATQCPGIDVNPDGSLAGQCEPIGKTHPVTATAAFREFAEDMSFTGRFRSCFGDYAAHACLWSPCP